MGGEMAAATSPRHTDSAAVGQVPHPSPSEVFSASRDHLVRRTAGVQKLLGANDYATSANGAEVRLHSGRTAVDLGTWAATVLGHRHPAVVAAVKRQCDQLPAAPRGLANPVTALLARRLVQLARPSRLDRVWFGANGADVVEAALKLARVTTGRTQVVALRSGFHGRTLGALAVSDADRYHTGLASLLREVSFIDPSGGEATGDAIGDRTAAVIIEIVQGSGAAEALPSALLRRWTDAARAAGAMVIVDEIQTGLWRCGEFSLGLSLGLDPDAVLFGKSLGGGVAPLSALLATTRLTSPLEAQPYLHSQTFSGHPLSCAAASATLDELPGLVEASLARVTDWLRRLGAELAKHDDLITEVRSLGLMMSLRFHTAEQADHFVMASARAGVLLAPSDGDRTVVRVLAPLVIDEAQMARAGAALRDVCRHRSAWPLRDGGRLAHTGG
ncbi:MULTISPECIES: aspartate aminotransferase family protein [unclassified Micromonospora]|uniref:aspartate aminotransferase family protein n=1 Tax=unclassified Micromonospora TaxID=2617518 RepID=UPI002FEFB4B6